MCDSIGRRLVLVVEDDPASLALLVDLLEKVGVEVILARRGQEVLPLVSAHRPDLIVMDVQLPGLDGLTLTRMLKSNSETRQIPILLVTAMAMKGDVGRIRSSGCDDYLPKPLDIRLFRQRLFALLAIGPADGRAVLGGA